MMNYHDYYYSFILNDFNRGLHCDTHSLLIQSKQFMYVFLPFFFFQNINSDIYSYNTYS